MTLTELRKIIKRLANNSAAVPTDAQIAERVTELWEDVQGVPAERLERARSWLVRRPDFRFFPTVGEILEALKRADRDAGEVQIPSNMTYEEYRLVQDPAYRKQQREISERAAQQYFASPEHRQLLDTMRLGRQDADTHSERGTGADVHTRHAPAEQTRGAIDAAEGTDPSAAGAELEFPEDVRTT